MTLRSALSAHFRSQRAALLRRVINTISGRRDSVTILDLGGRIPYWEQIGVGWLRSVNAKVTLLNIQASEFYGDSHGIFQSAIGDACKLHYDAGQFDLVHSNSVIEHVETWRNMKAFASETRRVGRSYYVQTPYFWFPIDPHFYAFPMFHWFPRQIRAKLLRSLPLAYAGRMSGVDKSFQAVDDSCLLDASQMKFLFPEAAIHFERFAGLRKSVIAISCH